MSVRALERSWARVRRLAARYPNDWEGQDLVGEDPLRVFAGARAPRRLLVVTKEAALKRWNRSDWPVDLVVVVADGILTRAQAAVLGELASDTSAPIAFVGDADPMDLHTYISLRAYLGARRVAFCGVSDALLDIIGDDELQPGRLSTRMLSAFDRAHLRIVATLARLEQALGPRVSAVLGNGRKLEIEALGFRADLTPALFKAALKLAWARRSSSGTAPKRRRRTRSGRL